MAKLKNFFKYLGILLGICLAIFLVLLAFMVLTGVSVFGYKYVNITSKDIEVQIVNSTTDDDCPANVSLIMQKMDKITINSSVLDVEMKPWREGYDVGNSSSEHSVVHVSNYKLEVEIKANGFVNTNDVSEVSVNWDVKPYGSDGKCELVIDVQAPSGFVNYTQGVLYVYTPFVNQTIYDDLADKSNFTGENNESISKLDKLHLTELNVTTTSGDVSVRDNVNQNVVSECYAGATIYINKLNVKTESGHQYYHRCGISNANCKSTSGDITFSALTNGAITGKQISLASDYGKILCKQGVNIGVNLGSKASTKSNVQILGKACQIHLNTLYNLALTYKGNADYITIGSLVFSGIEINSSNAFIDIGAIYSDSIVRLFYNEDNNESNQKGTRKIKIGYVECYDALILNTWSGNIDIDTLYYFPTIEGTISSISADSGKININNAVGDFNIGTITGNITVNQHSVYTSADQNALAQSMATNEYKHDLQSKQSYITELRGLLNTALTDNSYNKSIQLEIARVESEIEKLNTIIENRKNELISANIANSLNSKMRNSNFDVESKSGAITLNNIVCSVDVAAKENGTAPMYINFKEINASSDIHSGSGNLNITAPLNKANGTDDVYAVYVTSGTLHSQNSTFFGSVESLNSNQARASIATNEEITRNTITIEDQSDLLNLKAMFDCIITVSNVSGTASINIPA